MKKTLPVEEAINKLVIDLEETDKKEEPIVYRDIENTIGFLERVDADKLIDMPDWGDVAFYHNGKEVA